MANTAAPLESTRFCILLALARRPLHGYAIADQIDHDADNFIHLDHSTIYKALARLEADGHIKRGVAKPAHSRTVRYQLTPAGKRVLKIEADRLSRAIGLLSDRI